MVQAYLLRIYLFEGTIPSFCLRLELSFTSQNLVVQSAPTYTIVSSLGVVASTTSLLGSRSPRWRTLLLLPRAPPSRTRCLCPSCSRTHSPKHPEHRSTTVCWPSLLSQIFMSNLLLHCVIVEMHNCEKFLKN